MNLDEEIVVEKWGRIKHVTTIDRCSNWMEIEVRSVLALTARLR